MFGTYSLLILLVNRIKIYICQIHNDIYCTYSVVNHLWHTDVMKWFISVNASVYKTDFTYVFIFVI